MMVVYFHIDELARDAVVAAGLKKELETLGGRVVYGNRLTTNYLLRHFNSFDAVILPSLLHFMDAYPDPHDLPANVFILPTEAVGQATGTLRRIFGKYFGDDAVRCEPWHRAVAGFLLWGYAHINPFREYYPEYLAKARVVGHPRLSKSCNKPIRRAREHKLTVGFVSRFNGLNPYDSRTPFETVLSNMRFGKTRFTLYENSPDRDVEDTLFTEVIDFRITLQIMLSLDSEKYNIAVRPHPRENRFGWIRLMRKLNINATLSPWDEPFGHWLQGLDFIITPPSTSLYDIFYHGKAPIVTSEVVKARAAHLFTESDDRNQILEGVCRPTSVKEILARIESGDIPFDRDIVDRRLREQVAFDIAGEAIANMMAAITELSAGRPRATARQRGRLRLFGIVSFVASHLRWFKGVLQRRVEQGSSFYLTSRRIRWINRLAIPE